MKRTTKFVAGLSLLALLVVGQASYAAEMNQNTLSMMSGMSNMMNMMDNPGMINMMNAMNSPEGQAMMKNCNKFMESNTGVNKNEPAN
ncbi:hypothetical protein P4U99_22415 [Brevibacillus agri]|uniref:hypothetical protein n=1 Tax=Brevibacillus TaxID=55080 RepID=UPI0020413DE3|nr:MULTISPECIES: hypothetical protein [Brevibacillus]MCM3432568.1 hypothetical protein [Brevibacillus invocatus]MED1645906.1 hypothetical protein [Brevibacillus agri]MED1657603.1 hypothetical protein [Brevibacillus agri]MED1690095.1 hypothetical protein [Brevibacillus agri]MED1693988.1 hypothetical protein [Brevibacillus agri]